MIATAKNPITNIEGLSVALSAGGGTIDHIDFGAFRASMSRSAAATLVRRSRALQDQPSAVETMSAPVQTAKPAIERVPPRPTPVMTVAEQHRVRTELDALAAGDPAIALKLWKSNGGGVCDEFGSFEVYKMFLSDVESKVPRSQTPFQADARFEVDIKGSMPVSLLAEQHFQENRDNCRTEFAHQRGYELYLTEERRIACGG